VDFARLSGSQVRRPLTKEKQTTDYTELSV
jgi:hypothetical protein